MSQQEKALNRIWKSKLKKNNWAVILLTLYYLSLPKLNQLHR